MITYPNANLILTMISAPDLSVVLHLEAIDSQVDGQN